MCRIHLLSGFCNLHARLHFVSKSIIYASTEVTDTSLESVNWVTRRALICRLSKSESNRFMVEKMHVRGLVVVVEVLRLGCVGGGTKH